MQSQWNDHEAAQFGADPLGQRVYTSRLLGRESSLVLHGGGNTSVKAAATNVFGEAEPLLFVKGSGWDLATIERAGFAPVRLRVLLQLAGLETVSDADLVRQQRVAMTEPTAPDPSVEAVLHALIPPAFVDHTHADAVVALTNAPNAAATVAEVFGPRMLVVPYVMPGFALARAVFTLTRGMDWSAYDGMILLSHGIFTWGATARESYEAMIRMVTAAEHCLERRGALGAIAGAAHGPEDLRQLSALRRAVSGAAGRPMIARLDRGALSCGFAALANLTDVALRGPLTPDHVIRTKRVPMIVGDDPTADVAAFADSYRAYFSRCTGGSLTMLDAAPRWGVWPGQGIVAFGGSATEADIVADIAAHTIAAIQWAEALGGWRALPERELFEVEYWELEQAKLKRRGPGRALDGRVALVTGGASGIGRAVVAELAAQGAAVVSLDIATVDAQPAASTSIVHVRCDLTDSEATARGVAEAVRRFGGLDILVSNAGIFPGSARIEDVDSTNWDRTLAVNLTSHQRVLQACVPFLRNGIEPAVVVIGSKNVAAPGPGQAAYSVSKAGVTQLARVAALELAKDGIRVNVVHPNAVFDTGIWTNETLESRAAAYGLSVDEYKRNNLLGVDVTSRDVAVMVAALAGPAFRCTTGAQIPVDGGNDRVI
jgi:rhamnose utilization protein RhaD (predicted bifunctional aldolase and dehydrogenase)/NAD(P)-dependent dehydrogenase (short-subunit alcohol dehydrogenase family)